jgi:hypothetical protein
MLMVCEGTAGPLGGRSGEAAGGERGAGGRELTRPDEDGRRWRRVEGRGSRPSSWMRRARREGALSEGAAGREQSGRLETGLDELCWK